MTAGHTVPNTIPICHEVGLMCFSPIHCS